MARKNQKDALLMAIREKAIAKLAADAAAHSPADTKEDMEAHMAPNSPADLKEDATPPAKSTPVEGVSPFAAAGIAAKKKLAELHK